MYLQKVLTYGFDRETTGALIKFGPLAYADWGMLFLLGAAVLIYKEVFPLLRWKLLIGIILVTGASVVIGVPQALTRTMAVNDVRITLSFICGLCFAVNLRHSRLWHWHLILLLVCLVCLMLKAYRDATFGLSFVAGISGGGRLATINSVASIFNAVLILTTLLITLGSLRSRWALGFAFGWFFPAFYMAVISSGTRSALIYVVVALGVGLFIRAYGCPHRGLDARPSLFRLAWLGAFALASFSIFVFRYHAFIYEQALVFIARFKGESMAAESSSLRAMEVQALIKDLGFFDWIFGRGVGGVFPSPIYDGGLAPTLHVGVFTFLLKFGLPVFLVVIGILYCYLPYRFGRALARPHSESPQRRESIMLVFPCMLPLIGALTLSAGYGTGAMLWWGVLCGCYYCLQLDGLAPYLSVGRRGKSAPRSRAV